jgi:hypothetical protein
MSDLISRQAAIDAADRADYTGLTVEDVKKVTDEVVKELKKLPSVQPDYTAIKCEIQRNIDDFYNSKHHAQHVLSNGRMIAFGLELALDIVKEAERRTE